MSLAMVLAACSQGMHTTDATVDRVDVASDAVSDGTGLDGGGTSDIINIDSTDITVMDVPVDTGRPPGCRVIGTACSSAMDCCSGTCTGGICEMPTCISDHAACTTSTSCCSGNCMGGTCAPLNTGCRTLGNACTNDTDCCSMRCSGGVCAASSYCGQNGDVCQIGTDCCGGICNVAAGARLGTCSQPASGSANCTIVDGTVCGSMTSADGGIPACGGACCSRLCAPYGPTGVPICQPASGCHLTGDLCTRNEDCCGSTGGGVICNITAPATVGTCTLPSGCQPDGNVCRTATNSCNSRCDCCAGNCHADTCVPDSLGIPRCTGATCVNPGGTCTTSASCCNGHPCVVGPGGTFVCYDSLCVPVTGPCTTNADCCPGGVCMFPPGSTQGTCTGSPPPPDAGVPDAATDAAPDADTGVPPTCAMYGQLCTTAADCCAGLPCTPGFVGGSRCEPPPG